MDDFTPAPTSAANEGNTPDKSDDSRRNGKANTKPVRYPWEKEPFVDRKAAEEHAVSAAQRPRTDPKSPAVANYAQKALEAETSELANTPKGGGSQGGRNNALFLASAKLFEFVAADALTEAEVVAALETACRTNGLIDDKGQAQFDNTLASGRRKGLDCPRDLSGVGQHTNGFHVESETVKMVKLSSVFDLERGFWTSRKSLEHIYIAALARMCAPWAVLGYCAARVLALAPPSVVLPPLIGGQGSLNWFCAIAARSGGGKGGSARVAKLLIPSPVEQHGLGSGEGFLETYVVPANKETGKGLRDSVMFAADEVDTVKALSSRNGSTLDPILRSAFSGEVLDLSYRRRNDLPRLEENSYRATLVINVQPAKAGALLDDIYSGTLQRFMWFPGTDPRVKAQRPEFPGELTMPKFDNLLRYGGELQIPYEATELILDQRERNMSDESADPLASHSLLIREKFAYALAMLDGRDEMTFEDWQLAGIASRVSDRTREWVAAQMESAQLEDAKNRGKELGAVRDAADQEQAKHKGKRRNEIQARIVTKVGSAGKGGSTKRDALQSFDGDERMIASSVFENLCDQGELEKLERGKGERTDRWVVVQ